MKSLHDGLQRLFDAPSDSTPAVPAPLRNAAAESVAPACYDYPRVRSLDDLPPAPDSFADVLRRSGTAPSGGAPADDSALLPGYDGDRGECGVTGPVDLSVAEATPKRAPGLPPAGAENAARFQIACTFPESCCCGQPGIDDLLSGLEECDPRAFSKRLQRGVREIHAGNPVAFYTAAGISRSAYSRLVSHPDRHPSKDSVLAMAAAFRLSPEEAESFLRLAGYALSPGIASDVVWRKCFEHGLHDLPKIRALLARYS